METREEVMLGQLHDRRVDFLRDMDVRELLKLCPDEYLFVDTKELLIQEIIENVWDKQINEEVR